MNRRILVLIALLLVASTWAWAQFEDELASIDALLDAEDPDAALSQIASLEAQARGAVAAEVLWRKASATLMRGDQREDAGAGETELLSIFEAGEAAGEAAIAADPSNNLGYYWTSANVGRWGQTKGIVNSLFRAPDMRDLLTESVNRNPSHAESYFVLGQLYAQVPGVISFGNVEYAVSLGRQSVDLMEAELRSGERDERNFAFDIQLASHLIGRDWNRRRRGRDMDDIRRRFQNAGSPIERGFFYEGSVSVASQDDEQEAEAILREVIAQLGGITNPSPSDQRQLAEARELLAGL